MKAFKLIVSSLLLLVSVASFGSNQAGAVTCDTNTAIVYSNGMFNTREQAMGSLDKLQEILLQSNPAYGNTQLYQFELAYASDRDGLGQSTLDQILEVARYQYPNALIGSFWRWLGGIEAAPR